MGLRCTQSLNGALHSLSSWEPPSVPSAVLSIRSRLLTLSLLRFWDAISCTKVSILYEPLLMTCSLQIWTEMFCFARQPLSRGCWPELQVEQNTTPAQS